jgi:capsular polysaccharide transport system permease protein
MNTTRAANQVLRFPLPYQKWVRAHLGLLLFVALPTLVVVIYYVFWASDLFTSESRFVVRSADRAPSASIGTLLQGTGFGKTQDDSFAVKEYILSRDALQVLDQKLRIKAAFEDRKIDVFKRFAGLDGDNSFEALHDYYQGKVDVRTDSNSSIVTLTFKAFTPQDAVNANRILLEQSEQLVNRLNERGRQDLIRYARNEVELAEGRAKAAALSVSQYRTAQGVVDPERQASVQLQQVAKLQDELIATTTQLAQLQAFTPANPQVAVLKNRAATLQSEIAKEIVRVTGGQSSLANKAAGFQHLLLEAEFSSKQLGSALASLETARNDAQRKQVYLERISEPSTPDVAQEPRRIRGVFSTLILGLVAWGLFSMVLTGVREHSD